MSADPTKVILLEHHGSFPPGTLCQSIAGKVYLPDGSHCPAEKTTTPDGHALSREKYPMLYAVIGNRFGGDGAEFKVPDLRSVALIGTPIDLGVDL